MSAVSLQDIILPEEIIIGMLTDRDDLLNCRLVNQQWNYYATKVLSNTHSVAHFYTNEDLEGFMNSFVGTNYLVLPFSSYHFRVDIPSRYGWGPGAGMPLKRIELFFDHFGSHIRHHNYDVRLHDSGSRLDEYSRTVRSMIQLLHKTPLLKSLGIHLQDSQYLTGATPAASGYEFASFQPNNLVHLQTLRLGTIKKSQESWIIPILQQLRASAPNLREVHLCMSDIHSNLDPVVEVFSGLRMYLHGFGISITNYNVSDVHLKNKYKFHDLSLNLGLIDRPPSRVSYDEYHSRVKHWLRNHTNTLETLRIKAHVELWAIELPALLKLKTLTIFPSGVMPPRTKMRFLSLNPWNFPMLTKVDLVYRDNYGLFNGDSGSFDSVQELVFEYHWDHTYYHRFTSDPNHWGKIFPALKTFKFKVTHKDGLRHMMGCMTHVKDLTISNGRIMGYPTRVLCIQILDGTYVQDASTSTSLANFSQLKTLTIDSNCEYVVRALMNLTRSGALHPLQLILIEKSVNITEEGLDFLKSIHVQVKMVRLPTTPEKFPFSSY